MNECPHTPLLVHLRKAVVGHLNFRSAEAASLNLITIYRNMKKEYICMQSQTEIRNEEKAYTRNSRRAAVFDFEAPRIIPRRHAMAAVSSSAVFRVFRHCGRDAGGEKAMMGGQGDRKRSAPHEATILASPLLSRRIVLWPGLRL